MSAETLRRAAALMRERAEATYCTTDSGALADWHTPADLVGTFEEAGDGDHIASWHPAVALAVADWLDGIRFDHEYDANGIKRFCHAIEDRERALTVARAYLNESA